MAILPIAVWERSPYWVPELQRQSEPLGARVMTCRIEEDVARRVAEGARLLVIALPHEVRWPWQSLGRWVKSGLRVHVILDPADESYRWFLYELGATSVFDFQGARQSLVRACVG